MYISLVPIPKAEISLLGLLVITVSASPNSTNCQDRTYKPRIQHTSFTRVIFIDLCFEQITSPVTLLSIFAVVMVVILARDFAHHISLHRYLHTLHIIRYIIRYLAYSIYVCMYVYIICIPMVICIF